MANASFTRDEIILALDVLYSSPNLRVSADSPQMHELSALLNRLPIHPLSTRRPNFRSAHGIAKQLALFRSNCRTGTCSEDVGTLFFQVAFEFENDKGTLHTIAQSIRRNESGFSNCCESLLESSDFYEGALLGQLHRMVELRDGNKLPFNVRCELCGSCPSLCYQPCGQILQHHLVVSPAEMDYRQKYTAKHFITVCPTCHEALHHFRPWLTKENCGDLLR